MTRLRKKMIRELELHRKAPGTVSSYVKAVEELARYYGRSPDQISREEIRDYLHFLMVTKKLSYGSCNHKTYEPVSRVAHHAARIVSYRGCQAAERHHSCSRPKTPGDDRRKGSVYAVYLGFLVKACNGPLDSLGYCNGTSGGHEAE